MLNHDSFGFSGGAGSIDGIDKVFRRNLYLRLSYVFSDEQPDGPDKNFLECLNPDSLKIVNNCKVEKNMLKVASEFLKTENRTGINAPTFQFMRVGFFCLDNRDSSADHLVFNRSVLLKDGFKK